MNLDILKDLTQVAGIAGLVVGALVLIFGGIIQKNIFPNLTKEHGYKIMRMIIVFSFAIALVGLAGYFYLKGTGLDDQKIITIKGAVYSSVTNTPVAGATIEIEDEKGLMVYTDDEGKYFLKLKGLGEDIKEFKFVHRRFRTKFLNEQISFKEGSHQMEFKDVFLDPKDEETNEDERDNTVNPEASARGNASITLMYMGDELGCTLDLSLTIGRKTFKPQGNVIPIDELTEGRNDYNISGLIDCGWLGNCAANGSGVLNLRSGDKYYLVWDYSTCVCTLVSESEYRTLSGM